MFVHLHTHTHYSFLTALPRPEGLCRTASEQGSPAVAITDFGGLYGTIEMYEMGKKYGVKPIYGAELFTAPNRHDKTMNPENRRRTSIVLLAENTVGYHNLLQIITKAQLEGFFFRARVDMDLLREFREGIICLSGPMESEVAQELLMGNYAQARDIAVAYDTVFGRGNYYLELGTILEDEDQQAVNQGLIDIHHETGIPLVVGSNVHYLKREDADTHDVLLCIRDGRTVGDTNRFSLKRFNLAMRSENELREAFVDMPEALIAMDNTVDIASRIDVPLDLGHNHLPTYPLPDGVDADQYLRELCMEKFEKKSPGVAMNDVQKERLEYELQVIKSTGFASYFLIVQDFINWAKDNGVVVGPGRGSAAGSYVAYLTGITNLDPIKYDLLFERFLNPERISMPDVDTDFADDKRDLVLEYVKKRYGEDHVAQIITFGTMAARAAIRDVGRALAVPLPICDRLAKLVPFQTGLKEALETVPELKQEYEKSAEVKRLLDTAGQIEDLNRHASVHACGVVITKEPVYHYTAMQKVAGKDGIVTQYGASTKVNAVEKIGLLKMDFLGLRNLTVIQNTLKIAKKIGHEVPDIDTLPLDDAPSYELLQKGQTTGVFQLESTGMKRYLKSLKPTVFEDIIAMVALYRPGPMEYIPDFIAGKHGTREISYLHPKLEPILKATYGVAVYQEQLMQMGRDIAGFTLGEADVLRKAVGKKIKELVLEQKVKFIERSVQNGVAKVTAEKIFEFIEPFAGYGFNRSHAACYAMIGYQTAYLKAHFPAPFMAALLTGDQNDTDRIAIEVREAREIGIEVLPPSINESFESFAVAVGDDGKERIRFGLNAIKNVGWDVAEAIVNERKANGPYATLEEFCERLASTKQNKKSLESLIKVGALEMFGERAALLENIDKLLVHAKESLYRESTHADSLFGDIALEKPRIVLQNTITTGSVLQNLNWEKELLGLYVSSHPMVPFADYLRDTATPMNLLETLESKGARIGGVITSLRKTLTKTGSNMYFVGIEDSVGRIEAIAFGRNVEALEPLLVEGNVLMCNINIQHRDGEVRYSLESAEKLNLDAVHTFERTKATKQKYTKTEVAETIKPESTLTISLVDDIAPNSLMAVAQHLKDAPRGNVAVKIILRTNTIPSPHTIASENLEGLKTSLLALDGVASVV
jgi:DNA polymerase-3 subunit alpha